ncbi:hypothetical protein H0H93_006362 [Arthromyces matolae]|nr:hypothetical protein H0H93_006362 [Arthromyces matolae]
MISIFLLATASFAALTSAAPTWVDSRPDVTTLPNGVDTGKIVAVMKNVPLAVSGIPTLSGRDDLQSLPTILQDGKDKLTDVSTALNTLLASDNTVSAETLTPFIQQSGAILSDLLTAAKLLQGQPQEAILGVGGTVKDVATLVWAIVSLVVGILATVLKAASPATEVIQPVIDTVGSVLGELVPFLLSLVDGLLVILGPLLSSVFSLLGGLGLGNLLQSVTSQLPQL